MSTPTISILEGNVFAVSDRQGDMEASPTDTVGLFAADTRFLSRWVLTIDGKRLNALSTDDLDYRSAQFFLVPGTGTVYVDAPMSVVRRRHVGDGFQEDVSVLNHTGKPVTCEVRIEAAADFADLFEVKDALKKKGETYRRVEGGRLVLGYRREKFVRETSITASGNPTIEEAGLRFRAQIAPHGQWTTQIVVTANLHMFGGAKRAAAAKPAATTRLRRTKEDWVAHAPRLRSTWEPLEETYKRSVVDLAALRFFPMLAPDQALPAAGLPWFMALFGRDSLITSLQALPFYPELARTTLDVLGQRQGTRVDDFRDEEPGKILHESRMGEMTAFEERPHSPYFGTNDATPLFLVLLDEYERWSGDVKLVRGLEAQARAALDWIDHYGDRDHDGYVEYERRNTETGLENQCWKDSWNSIVFRDGTLAPLPRACCEIQGYVYDAKVRTARLARELWKDAELATRLEKEAADLKRRFNKDFWIPEREFFALALDGKKRKVDSLTSNIGHLLWSGIVDDDKIEAVVRHLMGPELFSGWGIRTMGTAEGAYNPIGYHVGTVWPHDTAFVALGLRRAGYAKEAARVSLAMLEAATYFRGRLPEAFAGYPRTETRFPVEYPTACSPQAWATGAPLLILRALLGLEAVAGRLLVDPAVPEAMGQIELLDIPGRWGLADAFGHGRVELAGREAAEAHPQAH
jgi:glycogen debranching enzyme